MNVSASGKLNLYGSNPGHRSIGPDEVYDEFDNGRANTGPDAVVDEFDNSRSRSSSSDYDSFSYSSGSDYVGGFFIG